MKTDVSPSPHGRFPISNADHFKSLDDDWTLSTCDQMICNDQRTFQVNTNCATVQSLCAPIFECTFGCKYNNTYPADP